MKLRNAAYLAIAAAAARKIVRKARGERPGKKVIFRSVPPPKDPQVALRIIRPPLNQSAAPLTGKYRVVHG